MMVPIKIDAVAEYTALGARHKVIVECKKNLKASSVRLSLNFMQKFKV